jgi:hypothetical protein
MEIEYNIIELHEDLGIQLCNWYNAQGFNILNRIHETNLFDYPENEIEYILNTFWEEWNELPIEERIEFYNQYKNFK